MYKYKISISINSRFKRDIIYNEFESLVTHLCKTGQIDVPPEGLYFTKKEIATFQTTPEKNSLSSKYNDKYVNQSIQNLESWCKSKLKTELMGRDSPYSESTCNCSKAKYFILYHHFDYSYPVFCGSCLKCIPAYKMKDLLHEDKDMIYDWQWNYKSCSNLELGSEVGERWSIRQMSDPHSQLSLQGRKICSRISEVTTKPAYYYLFNDRKITQAKDKLRKCPSCKGNWLVKKPKSRFIAFRCDKCKLVSSLTTNF